MMVLIVTDILGKYIFNKPIPGVLEMVAFYFMTMVVFFPLAYAQKTKQHLVIDLFTRSLSNKTNAKIDVLAGLISLAYLGMFAWASIQQALYMTSINHSAEILNYNLIVWPTLWIIPCSIILMMLWVACHIYQHLVFLGVVPVSSSADKNPKVQNNSDGGNPS